MKRTLKLGWGGCLRMFLTCAGFISINGVYRGAKGLCFTRVQIYSYSNQISPVFATALLVRLKPLKKIEMGIFLFPFLQLNEQSHPLSISFMSWLDRGLVARYKPEHTSLRPVWEQTGYKSYRNRTWFSSKSLIFFFLWQLMIHIHINIYKKYIV